VQAAAARRKFAVSEETLKSIDRYEKRGHKAPEGLKAAAEQTRDESLSIIAQSTFHRSHCLPAAFIH
jgi:hypothetical protein